MTTAIADFRGEFDFLSNFYPSPVVFENVEYPSIEPAFQAAKTMDYAVRRSIRNASTPSEAKRLGRSLQRRENWFEISLSIMESLILQKFTKYDDLREKLLSTGTAELIEGNNWNDRFYGAIWDSHKNEWVGENHLGRILMKVRDELRNNH